MKIGCVREIKDGETRAGILPKGASELVKLGHEVFIQSGIGGKIGIRDSSYAGAGAQIFRNAKNIWERAELIVKVKEPQPVELKLIREHQTIFSYLYLASAPDLVKALIGKKVIAIDYGTMQTKDGSMPLQYPMSDIAGKLAVDKGAQLLQIPKIGKGILLGGSDNTSAGFVTIIGAGVVGTAAAKRAQALGAHVTVFDKNKEKLAILAEKISSLVATFDISEQDILLEVLEKTDLLIGATLVPGALAEKSVKKKMVSKMEQGSVVVDVSIDQGGCIETSRLASRSRPIYIWKGIIHYCVPNMPALVGRTSTEALTFATLSYLVKIANGKENAIINNHEIYTGVNLCMGHVTNLALAESQGLKYVPLKELLLVL